MWDINTIRGLEIERMIEAGKESEDELKEFKKELEEVPD